MAGIVHRPAWLLLRLLLVLGGIHDDGEETVKVNKIHELKLVARTKCSALGWAQVAITSLNRTESGSRTRRESAFKYCVAQIKQLSVTDRDVNANGLPP